MVNQGCRTGDGPWLRHLASRFVAAAARSKPLALGLVVVATLAVLALVPGGRGPVERQPARSLDHRRPLEQHAAAVRAGAIHGCAMGVRKELREEPELPPLDAAAYCTCVIDAVIGGAGDGPTRARGVIAALAARKRPAVLQRIGRRCLDRTASGARAESSRTAWREVPRSVTAVSDSWERYRTPREAGHLARSPRRANPRGLSDNADGVQATIHNLVGRLGLVETGEDERSDSVVHWPLRARLKREPLLSLGVTGLVCLYRQRVVHGPARSGGEAA